MTSLSSSRERRVPGWTSAALEDGAPPNPDLGRPERRAGVAFSGAFDRVHGQEADRVGHQPRIDGGHGLRTSVSLGPARGVALPGFLGPLLLSVPTCGKREDLQ